MKWEKFYLCLILSGVVILTISTFSLISAEVAGYEHSGQISTLDQTESNLNPKPPSECNITEQDISAELNISGEKLYYAVESNDLEVYKQTKTGYESLGEYGDRCPFASTTTTGQTTTALTKSEQCKPLRNIQTFTYNGQTAISHSEFGGRDKILDFYNDQGLREMLQEHSSEQVFVTENNRVYVIDNGSAFSKELNKDIWCDVADGKIDGRYKISTETIVSTETNISTRSSTQAPVGPDTDPADSPVGYIKRIIIGLLSTEAVVAMSTAVVVVFLVVVWEKNSQR